MRILFALGLLCLAVLFTSRLESALSARFIDMFLAIELGLLLALYLFIRFYKFTPLRITFAVLSLMNFFYFIYSGAVNPLGGWLFTGINAVMYLFLFGLPVVWVCKVGKK
ncbi:MAG: hypothetical protein KKE94_06760 [Gammaproteobacteria bacterium]|nr:hypothetical protein [Gammaproteobacteria bacterium]